ncbi:hypothetical protein NIES2111_64550 (plasmid) [Nostoc sp. NIES-2111]|nr:hypothetical protein NIES2111_64550 [Nostoc sp. NIES-2111]
MNKIALFTALALIGTTLGACQSDEGKVAQAENDYAAKLTDAESPKEKAVQEQIRKYVEDTPDLYRISWKICGDYRSRLRNGIRCSETKIPKDKGYVDPVYVWAANGVQFVNKQHFVDSYWTTGLFVKSRGCLNSGKPEKEQFYNVKNFTRDKTSAIPTAADVKIEALSKQDKQTVVEQAFKDAEVENYALTNYGVSATTGLIPTAKDCLILEEWKTTQP